MNWAATFKVGVTVVGGGIGYLFGGWTGLLPILLVLMCIDQVSGLLASYFEGKLSSKVGFNGISKKVMVLFIIMVCHFIDQVCKNQGIYSGAVVRDGAIIFYLANEILSFIENAGRMGIPLPSGLVNAVAILKGKGEGK
ncbi:MAG: phage holin family protein [Ignavibacteria bacterium]|nr:phage holin family protein [Ignavibacteria bacterium]